jgi:hypothetical protein
MLMTTRVVLFMAAWMTPILRGLMEFGMGRPTRDPDPSVFEDLLMKEMERRPEIDKRCLDEYFKRHFVESCRESLRNGSRGVVWEAKLFGTDWGFDLEEVGYEGLALWHGSSDVNVPVSMPQKTVALLPSAELKVFEEGHINLMVNHIGEILEHLVADCSKL